MSKQCTYWIRAAVVVIMLLSACVQVNADEDECVNTCVNLGDGGQQHAGGDGDADYLCCWPGQPPQTVNRKCTEDDPAGHIQCSKYKVSLNPGELHSAWCEYSSPPGEIWKCERKDYTKVRMIGGCFPGDGETQGFCGYFFDQSGVMATFHTKICVEC